MKYLEELKPGTIFEYKNNRYLLTADFKDRDNTLKKMCISLTNGHVNWLDNNDIVQQIELYYRDNDHNILPL
jgi:hypothetical protein